MKLVTIIGGSGVFGSRIATELATHHGARVRIVGRHDSAGRVIAERIGAEFRVADIHDQAMLGGAIEGSEIVIHAAGPFQGRDYRVARACIERGCHYLDLADGRDFVFGINELDEAARARGVFATSGASSVPAITSAMIESARCDFRDIEEIQIALSPGNQNPRGASTIGAILTYLGRPIRVWQGGRWIARPGWGDARRLEFPPPVGRRRVHNCDVPDLDLFPGAFGARTVRFHAGVELNIINFALSAIANMRRLVPFPHLERLAPLFLRGSLPLYRFGSGNGALAAWLRGRDRDGSPIERRVAIVTEEDGPATPCSPSIILAKRLLDHGPPRVGAGPCMGLITLPELKAHLRPFGVWMASGDERGWTPRRGHDVSGFPPAGTSTRL